MEEHIKQIEGLIVANKAVAARTAFLNVALGCLETALANALEHVAAVARQAAAAKVQSLKAKG